MEVKLLEHVNLWTSKMEELASWYERVLGLKRGYRPPFDVPGIWLYIGGIPSIHLLEVKTMPPPPLDPKHQDPPRMEHFCLRATGLKQFLHRLKEEELEYTTLRVPELRVLQVYLFDPEGNHMHIDFPPEEGDEAGL
jgi:catechol 2,3-dioxygenase-like lactoylglutathione lyase family enzyme